MDADKTRIAKFSCLSKRIELRKLTLDFCGVSENSAASRSYSHNVFIYCTPLRCRTDRFPPQNVTIIYSSSKLIPRELKINYP